MWHLCVKSMISKPVIAILIHDSRLLSVVLSLLLSHRHYWKATPPRSPPSPLMPSFQVRTHSWSLHSIDVVRGPCRKPLGSLSHPAGIEHDGSHASSQGVGTYTIRLARYKFPLRKESSVSLSCVSYLAALVNHNFQSKSPTICFDPIRSYRHPRHVVGHLNNDGA